MRNIHIGDKVICSESGVVGTVLRFYTPTSCEEQTLIKTIGGREYHAPTRMWKPYTDGVKPAMTIYDELREGETYEYARELRTTTVSESFIVNIDISNNGDETVLTVCKQISAAKLEVVSAFTGDEAKELYQRLTNSASDLAMIRASKNLMLKIK